MSDTYKEFHVRLVDSRSYRLDKIYKPDCILTQAQRLQYM